MSELICAECGAPDAALRYDDVPLCVEHMLASEPLVKETTMAIVASMEMLPT